MALLDQRDFVQASAHSDHQPEIKRSLRILVIATEAPPVRGGIARIVGYLRDGLQERGHHTDVMAYPEVGRLVFGEVRLSSLIFKLPHLLRRMNEYDVVHIHGTTPTISDLSLLLISFCHPRPLVIYTHHVDLDFQAARFLNGIYNFVHHQLSARADATIAATSDTLNLLGTIRKGYVIPYGIDLAQFRSEGAKDEQFTVLFIGQFRPWKGVDVLLRAMSQVTNARLIVAGQGAEEKAYRLLAAERGLDCEFHISVSDDQLHVLYQRAHVVIVPSVSRLEAFGLALVEGMAAGCIPIASDLPGVCEVVGHSGFLFPQGDADALAVILRNLRDHPERVQQLGADARLRSGEFDRASTIREYERVMIELKACREK